MRSAWRESEETRNILLRESNRLLSTISKEIRRFARQKDSPNGIMSSGLILKMTGYELINLLSVNKEFHPSSSKYRHNFR
jgi:hypothetical protein